MARRTRKTEESIVLHRPRDLRALRSPVRQDIAHILEAEGPASVSEIARRLGRSRHSLYYHVHELQRAGLLRVEETRPTTRRSETVYALVSRAQVIDPSQRSQAFMRGLEGMYTALLRRAERDVRRGVREDAKRSPDEPRACGVFSATARLTPASRKELRERLMELGDWIEAQDEPTAGASTVTIAFHPAQLTRGGPRES